MPFSRLQQSAMIAASLAISALAGWAAAAVHLPLPWMLGPLFSIAILRVAGLPLVALPGGRQAGQWAIGTALGLYFTPAVLSELGRHAPAILLMAGSAVLLGIVSARQLERWGQVTPATALFAGLPGGASEMVVLADRHGGQIDRVAGAHALRVMLVVSVIPFVLHHSAYEGHETFIAIARAVDWARFPMLLVVSLAGVFVFSRLRIANAWVLGPLLCIGALTAASVTLTSLPGWLVNGGQLMIGSALGNRFSPSFFRAAPRFLSVSAGATVLTLLLCAAIVSLLGLMIPIPFAPLLLAASPGGMAEMSITAREMHLSVPLVTATHVLRVVLLTVFAPLLCRYYLAWRSNNFSSKN
ncbi:AbrB family transcriptional regulator [Janthinobacterium sp. 17J80-10]|nr:AbrB family transcriptional regulator [Janthinobacterium sp. 17J80-10]